MSLQRLAQRLSGDDGGGSDSGEQHGGSGPCLGADTAGPEAAHQVGSCWCCCFDCPGGSPPVACPSEFSCHHVLSVGTTPESG